ncbi:GNAT family N-acetyltransferase [Pseudomonas sp. GD03858]|uniref:GNAT family N-acetyltransferase n=1 Tax=unclassified Pseudomonas TaxID=196821 RepID=UPI00244B1099|nr:MULTISPECIES: GNAT family N-acetyltransferase [unclassified Pseudomonas]MDH0646246.1 GNAT family N-acetyltransferase [Pseudomonas sp. GD03867]MDH0661755.1 GNAT family N-acetyltransferase [Pseudomonas sp. GD03858]
MEVRQITLNDLNGFYSLFCEVNAEGRYSARSTPPPLEAIERALNQVVKKSWPVYVIEHGGKIVGSAEAYPESFCRPGGSDSIGVLGMQVKREYRRNGYGSALLSAVIEHCRRTGFTSVDLSVFESNKPARSLYEKLGFTRLEDLPPCTLTCGKLEQPIKMRLAL